MDETLERRRGNKKDWLHWLQGLVPRCGALHRQSDQLCLRRSLVLRLRAGACAVEQPGVGPWALPFLVVPFLVVPFLVVPVLSQKTAKRPGKRPRGIAPLHRFPVACGMGAVDGRAGCACGVCLWYVV